MNIAFTICSNNYLAYAKTLGDSFLHFHPDIKFIIGLVDRLNDTVDLKFLQEFDIIFVEELCIKEFEELNIKYNIVELNTAVKPAYIHYIFQKYQVKKLLYIDPDILVTSRFVEVLDLLDHNNIVLTPHITTPIDDEFSPTDHHTLRGGIFNLGFIALSNYAEIIPFINWWHDRVVKYGYADLAKNMFYDQLWINYVPTLFENYIILKHPGYNVANWNLHERSLSVNENGEYIVNNIYPLRFFHFSGYKYNKPDIICSYLTRYNFESRRDLVSLFEEYTQLLIKNDVSKLSTLPIFYYSVVRKEHTLVERKVNNILYRLNTAFKILLRGHA